jgi:hypothetical protein
MKTKMLLVVTIYLITLMAIVATRSVSNAAGRSSGVNHEAQNARNGKVRLSSQVMTSDTAKRLSTEMTFSGSQIGGQYQVPGEATSRVENEKPIEELLGLRKNFRDRIKQDEERD